MLTLLNVFVTVLVILAVYLIKRHNRNKRFWKLLDQFYGPPALPLIGNAHQLGSDSEEVIKITQEICRKAGYTTYKFVVGNTAFINLCDPHTIEVLLSNNKEINKMEDYSFLADWLGDGLLLSTGAKWRNRRKIITKAFHFKILEQFVKVFNDNGDILIKQLSKEKGKVFNICPFFNYYALDVICETAMGVSLNAQTTDTNSEYVNAVQSLCALIGKRFISPWKRIPWMYKFSNDHKEFQKHVKTLHKMTNDVIRTRRHILKDQIEKVQNGIELDENQDEFISSKKNPAFLDLLLLSKQADGTFLSDSDIRDETDTFMFGGHDTTSTTMGFVCYALAHNPEVQKKAYEEVKNIVGDDTRTELTYEQLQNMKYLDMVIKETLRVYPTVPGIGRVIENDMELSDGKIIPAGCCVIVDIMEMNRNPRYFTDPEKFDPERFSPENTAGKNPYMFVPFSAGARNCIGQKFAVLEIKSVISRILMNYELLSGGDAKLRLVAEITLSSLEGINIIIKDRK